MEELLDRMRQKPPHKKQRIAFLSALSITAVIFFFWISTFTAKINGLADNDKVKYPNGAVSENIASAERGFESFKRSITSIFKSDKPEQPLELEVLEPKAKPDPFFN